MALGNNRDYKTNDRRVRKNLTEHFRLMNELIASGETREEASRHALQVVLHGKEKK
jgi:hypothetical protein